MALTPEQDAAVKAHVDKHLTRGCPICGQTQFFLGDDVFIVPVRGGPVVQKGHPLISVSCQTCGYAMYFNVFYMGLGSLFGLKTVSQIEKEKAEKTKDKASGE